MAMDIFQLVGNFWAEDQRAHLTPNATRLYFFLIHEANRKFWRGPLFLSWSYLQGALGLCRDSLSRAISDLKSRDLIIYEKRGKKATFWFSWSAQQTENQTNIPHRSVRRTENQTANQTDDQTENQTENQTVNNNILIQENNKGSFEDRNSLEARSDSSGSSISLLKSFKEKFFHAYSTLSKTEQVIVDTWEFVTGVPWCLPWINKLREALAICYPAQVKAAITTIAKNQPGKLQKAGFPYIMPILVNGAFGKRTKRRGKYGEDRENVEIFKDPAGESSITEDELLDAVITSKKSKRSLRKVQE